MKVELRCFAKKKKNLPHDKANSDKPWFSLCSPQYTTLNQMQIVHMLTTWASDTLKRSSLLWLVEYGPHDHPDTGPLGLGEDGHVPLVLLKIYQKRNVLLIPDKFTKAFWGPQSRCPTVWKVTRCTGGKKKKRKERKRNSTKAQTKAEEPSWLQCFWGNAQVYLECIEGRILGERGNTVDKYCFTTIFIVSGNYYDSVPASLSLCAVTVSNRPSHC